ENGQQGITINISRFLDSIWKVGNIQLPPSYSDSSNYNFRLKNPSPCINAGNPDTSGLGLLAQDLDGNNRIVYNRIDIGCYELDSLAPFIQNLSVSPHKINVNGWADSTFSLNISSNTSWVIGNTASWINLS